MKRSHCLSFLCIIRVESYAALLTDMLISFCSIARFQGWVWWEVYLVESFTRIDLIVFSPPSAPLLFEKGNSDTAPRGTARQPEELLLWCGGELVLVT